MRLAAACYNPRPRRRWAYVDPEREPQRADTRRPKGSHQRMKKGFYTIMSAQFFSSLADNALLVAAIELLRTSQAPTWQIPGA